MFGPSAVVAELVFNRTHTLVPWEIYFLKMDKGKLTNHVLLQFPSQKGSDV